MNWQAVDFDWAQVRAFLATAEEGSLSAAARLLGLTQPTLGRQVSALEERLGVTLFERSGRTLRLTQAGRDLMVPASAMRDAAIQVSLTAAGQAQSVSGRVTITATDVVAANVLPPILAELRQIAPGIEPKVIASNDVQDLTKREADISIRHARPEQPELFAKLITERSGYLYAAKSYLERVGYPKTLEDVGHMDFVGFSDVARMVPIVRAIGVPIREENVRSTSESGPAIAGMVKAGMGVSILTEYVANLTGGMEKLLEDQLEVKIPLWLVTHAELQTSRRIRIVFDLLADHLGRDGVMV